MSTTPSYFKIGLFCLVAVALGLGAVIALGAGLFEPDRIPMETYLDESAQGLEIGSPVKYRGVHVGDIEDIAFTYNKYELEKRPDDRQPYVCIEVGLFPDAFGSRGLPGIRHLLDQWVEMGLRARLRSQGVTGMAYLELDFMDPEHYKPLPIDWQPRGYYIPSAPSLRVSLEESLVSMSKTLKNLEEANIESIGGHVDRLIKEVMKLFETAQPEKLRQRTDELLVELRELAARMHELLDRPDLEVIISDVSEISRDARSLLGSSRQNVTDAISALNKTAENVQAASEQLPQAVSELNRALRRVNSMVGGRQEDIADILTNLRSISANLEQLTNNAKDYPAHLLFGEPPPVSEPAK